MLLQSRRRSQRSKLRRLSFEEMESRRLLATVIIDPGNYTGPYEAGNPGASQSYTGTQTVDLNAGTYRIDLGGAGSFFQFDVDALGNVTTQNSVPAAASGNKLTFNTATITVDPGASAGGYYMPSFGFQNGAATRSYVLGMRYALSPGCVNRPMLSRPFNHRDENDYDAVGFNERPTLDHDRLVRPINSMGTSVNLPIRAVAIVAAFAASVLSSPAEAQRLFTDAETTAIEMFLSEQFADAAAGMAVGLLDQNGSQVLAAGVLDNDTDQDFGGDTIFEIGSVTKTMTSLLLLDMARRGEIDPDDSVNNHLPANVVVPNRDGQEITLLHLAAQESGLPFNPDNLGADERFWVDAYNEYTVDDMYRFLNSCELLFAPGERYEYSNIGFTLLGHIIERKTGQDFETLVRSRICEPLEMTDTLVTLRPEQRSRLAMGHDLEGKRAPKYQLRAIAPAGALLSTVNDLLRYVAANLGLRQTDLSPLMKEMHIIRHEGTGRFGRSAMPWIDENAYNPDGSLLLGHAGGTPGGGAFVGFDVKQCRGVVVLSNQKTLRPAAIGWRILQGRPLTTDNSVVREFVGIGTGLDRDEASGLLRITKVHSGSTASQAGLIPDTIIRAINGVSVGDKSLPQCIGLMQGPAGTKVRLEVVAPATQQAYEVELTKQVFVAE